MKNDHRTFSLAQVHAHATKHGLPLPDGLAETRARQPNAGPSEPKKAADTHLEGLAKPRAANKTEQRFIDILEARKRRGEIDSVRYEGIRLKWGGGMHYTPDAIVFADGKVTLYEVKGGHIFDRDLVRFKGCRAEWPEFHFEMHQWKAGEWRRIY